MEASSGSQRSGQTEKVRLRAGGLTTIERLRGERTYADNGKEVRRQR